jgi:hypothetical protein
MAAAGGFSCRSGGSDVGDLVCVVGDAGLDVGVNTRYPAYDEDLRIEDCNQGLVRPWECGREPWNC